MKHTIKDEKCPYCGETEFLTFIEPTGLQNYLVPEYDSFFNETDKYLRHVICRSCGSVVRSYIKNPELLLPKKDRREN
ncbi:MAG: hypothetical protein IKK66_05470 [Ruminococcus sp.]|nr:hypothetical protein [Ruminococcus sp.]